MKRKRTDLELREMAHEHVRYELEMMQLAAKSLTALRPGQIAETNVLIESFLLHTRNIRDFLYRDSSKDETDVLAVDFVDDPANWSANRPKLAEAISNNRERINRALAHLSYSRLEYQANKGWPVQELRQGIEEAFAAFLKVVTKERAAWFVL